MRAIVDTPDKQKSIAGSNPYKPPWFQANSRWLRTLTPKSSGKSCGWRRIMIDDRHNPNLPPDPYGEPPLGHDLMGRRPSPGDRMGWGIFAALAIIVLMIGGLFWYGAAHEQTTSTARYQAPPNLSAPATPSAADPPVRPNAPATK